MIRTCAAVAVILSFFIASARAVITIAPLGDSIVAGYDGAPMAGYRQYLLNDLAIQGIQIQYQGVYDPTPIGSLGASPAMTAIGQNNITAFGGFTSADILNNLAGNVPSPNLPTTGTFTTNQGGYWFTGGSGTVRSAINPNMVLLQIGDNDAVSAYTTPIPPAQTDANITAILNWFAANRPNTLAIIGSPPPAIASSPLYTQEIAAASPLENTWLKANITPSEFPNARFVDEYDAFLNPDGSTNTGLLSGDGIHPDDAGYSIIAGLYDSAIVSAVPEPTTASLAVIGFAALFRRRSRLSSLPH